MSQVTGSLRNMLMMGATKLPEVGMGVTILHWTDRSAGTIVEVSKSQKSFYYTRDAERRTDDNGMSEMQGYEYTPQPDAPRILVKQVSRGAHKGKWREEGGGSFVAIGFRAAYRDYSF